MGIIAILAGYAIFFAVACAFMSRNNKVTTTIVFKSVDVTPSTKYIGVSDEVLKNVLSALIVIVSVMLED